MASLWEKIQALEGPSLITTGHGELFTVVAVDDDRIVIEVGPHGVHVQLTGGNFKGPRRLACLQLTSFRIN